VRAEPASTHVNRAELDKFDNSARMVKTWTVSLWGLKLHTTREVGLLTTSGASQAELSRDARATTLRVRDAIINALLHL
jgi:hypothetical protein